MKYITQQDIKNYFCSRDDHLEEKVDEALKIANAAYERANAAAIRIQNINSKRRRLKVTVTKGRHTVVVESCQ